MKNEKRVTVMKFHNLKGKSRILNTHIKKGHRKKKPLQMRIFGGESQHP